MLKLSMMTFALIFSIVIYKAVERSNYAESQGYHSHTAISSIQSQFAKELSFLTIGEQNLLCDNKFYNELCSELIAQ
tara:strand:- start:479 stop:709 length:231 start_codon:yes stop_codon:yes gene_type:complete